MPPPRNLPARLIDQLRQADWLTRDRVIAWGFVLFIEELLLLAFLALWQHGVFVPVSVPTGVGFRQLLCCRKARVGRDAATRL